MFSDHVTGFKFGGGEVSGGSTKSPSLLHLISEAFPKLFQTHICPLISPALWLQQYCHILSEGYRHTILTLMELFRILLECSNVTNNN